MEQAKRLKALEKENTRLKRLVAEMRYGMSERHAYRPPAPEARFPRSQAPIWSRGVDFTWSRV